MTMKTESIQSYLARGGKITKLSLRARRPSKTKSKQVENTAQVQTHDSTQSFRRAA